MTSLETSAFLVRPRLIGNTLRYIGFAMRIDREVPVPSFKPKLNASFRRFNFGRRLNGVGNHGSANSPRAASLFSLPHPT